MKKLFLLTLIVLFLSVSVFSGTLSVTSPRAGQLLYKGRTYNITWTSMDCSDRSVKINIFRNSISESNFVNQITGPNTGSKSWPIPLSYAVGNYILRVKTSDEVCIGDSAVFSIANEPSEDTGRINVTQPDSSTSWLRGTTKTITWDNIGSVDSNVKINIFKNSISEANFISQLTGPNTGSKSWPIPSSYVSGTYYLRVKEAEGDIFGDSSGFQITSRSLSPHSIKVVEPNGGRDLALRGKMRILWKSKNLTNNVKISLMKNGELFGVIADDLAPGRISHDWEIGRTLTNTASADTGFKIKVEEINTGISDQSDSEFEITAERNVDLSCYVSGHRSKSSGRVAEISVKVRVNNIGSEVLHDVPVRVTVKVEGETSGGETEIEYISEVTYKGHSYEYTLKFDFRLHDGPRNLPRRRLDRVAVVVVDPDDLFLDKRRLNNTTTYKFNF